MGRHFSKTVGKNFGKVSNYIIKSSENIYIKIKSKTEKMEKRKEQNMLSGRGVGYPSCFEPYSVMMCTVFYYKRDLTSR